MAKHIKDILTEWFYRLPNGYAIKPYNQKELQVLEQILQEKGIEPDSIIHSLQENDSQLDQAFNKAEPVDEAPADDQFIPGQDKLDVGTTTAPAKEPGPSKEYNDAIKRRLGVDVIPAATGTYRKPPGGSYTLTGWTAEDKKIFEDLWPENNNSAIVGKGEIALYWLFNYQKNQVVAQDARGGEDPDLEIGGVPAEVKSYKSHNMITGLGRWSDYKPERRIVQNIFGVHALTKAFKEGDTANPITEITFGKKQLVEAAASLFTFLNLPGVENLTKEPPEGFGKDSIFSNMIANAKSVFPEMYKSLLASGVADVSELNKSSTPEDVAIQVLQMLAAKKYGNKPGNMGYIVNIIPGKADVHFHQIDIAAIDSKATDSLNVSGGTIKGNLGKIFG